jgi:hypothetical protein
MAETEKEIQEAIEHWVETIQQKLGLTLDEDGLKILRRTVARIYRDGAGSAASAMNGGHQALLQNLQEIIRGHMQPSNFLDQPYDGATGHFEDEIVAHNIMAILSRTGDQWRTLEWSEYVAVRKEDGEFSDGEYASFVKVLPFCVSEASAKLFSPAWNKG